MPSRKKAVYTTSWPMRKTVHVIEMQMNKEIECVSKQKKKEHETCTLPFNTAVCHTLDNEMKCIPLRFYGYAADGSWECNEPRTKRIAIFKYLHWTRAYHQVHRMNAIEMEWKEWQNHIILFFQLLISTHSFQMWTPQRILRVKQIWVISRVDLHYLTSS